jgi:hypothetical protein
VGIQDFRAFGEKPGFVHFEDMCSVLEDGSFSPTLVSIRNNVARRVEIYQASSPSILSLSGGGSNYRGIYDTGLKRGFMGYIGLLLNAPYKIDSMMG